MFRSAYIKILPRCHTKAIAIQKRCLHVSSYTHQKPEAGPSEHTLVSTQNGIRRITLNSLKKRNALSLTMLEELKQRLLDCHEDKNVRVAIIDHNGPVFSSGHDLKELQSTTGSEYHTKIFQTCTEVMNLVQDIDVPVIAEVNGVATAAGCQLVATCDLAVASVKSIFAVPGVLLGLFCSTPGVALSRAVNRKQALKMLLTGESISASEALSSGLINEMVTEGKVAETSQKLAETIIHHSRSVIAVGKKTFYQQVKETRDEAYCLAENVMVENLKHVDSQEGIDAFFTKRKPSWTDE